MNYNIFACYIVRKDDDQFRIFFMCINDIDKNHYNSTDGQEENYHEFSTTKDWFKIISC